MGLTIQFFSHLENRCFLPIHMSAGVAELLPKPSFRWSLSVGLNLSILPKLSSKSPPWDLESDHTITPNVSFLARYVTSLKSMCEGIFLCLILYWPHTLCVVHHSPHCGLFQYSQLLHKKTSHHCWSPPVFSGIGTPVVYCSLCTALEKEAYAVSGLCWLLYVSAFPGLPIL